LAKRIDDDARARHRGQRKLTDRREKVLRELDRIAFADIRDIVQWDRKPRYDDEGNLIEIVDEANVAPSRLLSRDSAATIKSIRKLKYGMKFDTHGKLDALDKLAKILGLYQDDAPAPTVTVNQVNLGGADNALEAARRLAFALARLGQVAPMIEGQAVAESETEIDKP